ncbi:hypothetical protein L873DRAFT_1823955 [Choiromyces venosus 120613-1]|uniref:Uncharacterized protein n=1 Tax=Choiromyces venosus 120613-1 TaxID=1336337 RepID=A0A3N4ISU0_9PEZI|nr:hypothetical protein L873DRAFT_1823955 [Choiromyces venosus 120613-1]
MGDIPHDKFGNLASEGWGEDDTLDLEFDPLREFINNATKRHLFQEGVLQED